MDLSDNQNLVSDSQKSVEDYQLRLTKLSDFLDLLKDDYLKKYMHKFAEFWGSILKNAVYVQENVQGKPLNAGIASH
eukprot:CAMPEP_0116941122 /NCGR_PEP_ID=MMETSP0467-20121206/33787_1 /TAXON_ID=283647 /ORGANISM="Mesodinium pulex, Strain SPMC105" /LENGTH=76 /DNA_ID=CAMNT_0004623819 /DNA_START=1892 /DNA_END=2122 /DNA_ORIENTATION=+